MQNTRHDVEEATGTSAAGGLTRRRLLAGSGLAAAGAGGLAAASVAGYYLPHATPGRPTQVTSPSHVPSADVQHFLSRPDLVPPRMTVAHPLSAAAGLADSSVGPLGASRYILLGNKGYTTSPVGQNGKTIIDRTGRIVWFSPIADGEVADLTVQSYRGKPVLTWWNGEFQEEHGLGNCYIADQSYNVIATVSAGNGLKADMHEFNLTDQGTALITAYRRHRKVDLSALGGPSNGEVWSGVAQEIDIATGAVVFEWDSLNHVPVTETELPQVYKGDGTADNPFDYFHINSIGVMPDGDLLISSRQTWAIYKVGRQDGKIRWQLGGRRSDFTFGPGARFYWQHHARAHGSGLISLFDDGSSPPEEGQSRGLLLHLDAASRHVTLRREFTHPAHLLADNQGSMQLLPGGRAFVGWGAEPYFTEYAADGTILLDGQLPVGNQSYRAFSAAWAGLPADRPAVVATENPARGSAVYVSWNGATEVKTWRVYAAKSASSLSPVASQPRSGFETVISVNRTGPYFQVTAHDSAGALIGRSATVERR